MVAFIDPRGELEAPSLSRTPCARTTPDPDALTELHQLCRAGRLYDVERWIKDGRPLQLADGITVKGRRLTSALEIALDDGNHALVLLLLCNGYDPNLEPRSPLDLVLRARRWDPSSCCSVASRSTEALPEAEAIERRLTSTRSSPGYGRRTSARCTTTESRCMDAHASIVASHCGPPLRGSAPRAGTVCASPARSSWIV